MLRSHKLNRVSKLHQRLKKRSTWVSVWVNIVLVLLQFFAGVWYTSTALIADAIHSLSDIVSDAVVLIATRFSAHAPDEDHPYGHHRFENGASLVLGMLLVLVGLGLVWNAGTGLWQYFSQPIVANISWVAAGIAGFVLVSKELLFHYLMRVAKRLKSRLLAANAWHARADALSSLVVLVGLIGFALGYAWLDRLAALVVGFMIVKAGADFAWSALCDLMDQSVPAHDLDTLRTLASRVEGVLGIHDLKARRAGDGMFVDIHIDVRGDQTVRQGHDIAHAVRDALLKHEHVIDVLVHVDPA